MNEESIILQEHGKSLPYHGIEQISGHIRCNECMGTGIVAMINFTSAECHKCRGTGHIRRKK